MSTIGAHRERREILVTKTEIVVAAMAFALAAFLFYSMGMAVREYNDLRPNPSPLPTATVPTSPR